ncbi:MAG: twin-arginine translocase TatA/TatE family subunit [Sodaliphilus sp.]
MNSVLLLFNLGTGEIIIIALVVLLLFGGKKIPELMKGIGKGVRNFKKGLNEVEDEIKNATKEDDTKGKSASNPAGKP